MAKKILILNGSPRKKGNTAFLVERLVAGIREADHNAEIEVVRIAEKNIGPCRGCDACRRETKPFPYCAFHDDMEGLYGKVAEAHVIVLASPIYWFTVTAQMKLFLDRLYGLWAEKTHALRDKVYAGLLVYGDEDPYISGAVNAIGMIEDIARYCGGSLGGIVYGTANDLGDAEKNKDLCRKVEALGRSLASAGRETLS